MPQYAIVLLYPDYLTDNFGQETYTEIIHAENAAVAVQHIQRSLAVNHDIEDPTDFHPLAVITGRDLAFV